MNKIKKIGIWGQYGDGGTIADGQAVRTTIITEELKKRYGNENISIVNTNNWKKHPFRFFLKSVGLLVNCKNVIILPADNGFKTIVPIYDIFNRLFKRSLYYIVIGGFLPKLLQDRPSYIRRLKKYRRLYVQTPNIKNDLEALGIRRIKYITNLKPIIPRDEQAIRLNTSKYVKVCTLSRINKDKGIEDAIEAVRLTNEKLGDKCFHLDIFGIVAKEYEKRFENILRRNEKNVSYCGVVNYDQTVEVLQNYFVLLFPTYFHGEGFSGNVIDAYFSGVPIIATDWLYNKDVINNGVNGILVPIKDPKAISNALLELYHDRNRVMQMSLNNLKESKKYNADSVLKNLYKDLDR